MKSYFNKSFLPAAAFVACLAATFTTSPARAGDQMYGFYGIEARDNTSPVQRTYTFQFEYMHDINDLFSYSIDNANQGHFNQGIEHHRDYDGGNFWAHTDLFDKQLRLAAGVGAMFYYDTTGGTYGHANQDIHGLGESYTLSATWTGLSPFLFSLRANWIEAGSFNTRAIMFGVGYDLGSGSSRSASGMAGSQDWQYYKNEITIYGGKSIINEPGDTHSNSFAIEYRHDLTSWAQVSERFLDEGKSGVSNRRGLISEGWLDKTFFDNHVTLGVGLGVYLANDPMQAGSKTFVAPVRSYMLAYNVTPRFSVRTIWDRPITNNGRDSDVALVGFGYRF